LKGIESVTAFILAGGKSTRFGKDKAFLRYRKKSFVDIIIESTADVFSDVYIIGRKYDHPRLSGHCYDEISGIGPIAGIYTALKKTDTKINFFVGVDYPFIDAGILRYLLEKALDSCSYYDGLVPVMPDGAHPLFAFYGKACLQSTERCIEEGTYRLKCISRYSRICSLHISSQIADPSFNRFQKNFININHYEDYMRFIHQVLE